MFWGSPSQLLSLLSTAPTTAEKVFCPHVRARVQALAHSMQKTAFIVCTHTLWIAFCVRAMNCRMSTLRGELEGVGAS